MQYTVEDVSPVQRTVKVTVPAEEVNAAILATTALYRRDADMKGFRKGKVPANMVESRFKKQIVNEATTDLVNLHINEVLAELKIIPLSGLKVDGDELTKDSDYSYSFSFEVAPDFALPQYKGLAVDQEAVQVKPDEVDAVVNRIRDNLAELVDVEENRKAQDGDIAVVSFAALAEGEFEGLKADNFQLELGKGQAIPDFEAQVKTLAPGENTTANITFPEDFLNTQLAGKTVEMRIHLKELKQKQLPELTDELATKAGGFENVLKMREAIEGSYRKSREQLVKAGAQKKLLDRLLDGLDFPLPPSLVEKNLNFLLSDRVDRLERRGKSLASMGKDVEGFKAELKPEAEALTKNQVLLLAIANAEGLTVEPREVEMVIHQAAAQTGQDFQHLKQMHEKAGTIFDIKDRLLADKAMDVVYDHATVTEVPAAETQADSEGETA